jgi:hypothetical protein
MTRLLGCDFSSSPSKRKPIAVAWGEFAGDRVSLKSLELLPTLAAFSDCLQINREWVGGFDLPFGLPRELVLSLGWPTAWHACMQRYSQLSREQIRLAFAQFCQARPVGGKFAHRATDQPAGSSPSMKWVNPPVAFMMHAGVPLLMQAGVHFPGLHDGDTQRVALETYPGMWARRVLHRESYKNDAVAKQNTERWVARKNLLHALVWGHDDLPLRLKLSADMADRLVDDASGDSLDAVMCMLQAGWAQQQYARGDALYGLPADMDRLEGWIVNA